MRVRVYGDFVTARCAYNRRAAIGMNVAAMALRDSPLAFDVNQSAAIVCDPKQRGGTSSVFILGGGSPKNFILQTEPQIQARATS